MHLQNPTRTEIRNALEKLAAGDALTVGKTYPPARLYGWAKSCGRKVSVTKVKEGRRHTGWRCEVLEVNVQSVTRVVYQVKDCADGWIEFTTAKAAMAEVEAMGEALVRVVVLGDLADLV